MRSREALNVLPKYVSEGLGVGLLMMCICGLAPQGMLAQSQTPDIAVSTTAVSSCAEGHNYVLKNKVENKWLIVNGDGKLAVTDAAPTSGASSASAYIFTALTGNRLDVELDNLNDPFGVNVGGGETNMQLAPKRRTVAQDPTLQIYDRNSKLIVCYNGVVSFTASTNHANTQWYAYEVHSYTVYEWYWANDCSEAWYRCKCAYCGEVNEEKSLKATITQFAPVAATCTKAAYTSYKATVVLNGEEMTDDKSLSQGQPNGHNYVDGECTVCHMPLITYRVPTYNTEGDPSSGIQSWETRTCPDDAEEVTNSTYFGNGWYYVRAGKTVTFEERVSMPGDVHLILCDGSTVNFNEGIEASGGALTIYGQSRNTGRLVANASDADAIYVESYYGITINGGTITATVTSETGDGISVAAATWRDHGITINGGNVTAVGRGSGSGLNADYDGEASEGTYPHLYINGGTVCAKVDEPDWNDTRAFRGRAYANRSMNHIYYYDSQRYEYTVAEELQMLHADYVDCSHRLSEATFYTLIPGDLNKDGNVTIADLTQLIQLLNQGGTITNRAADVNKDGSVNVADVEKLRDKVLGVKETTDHEYVDLGLPSHTLWATCNIGAESPEESGLYFAWGETTGYEVGHAFSWANYKWMTSGMSDWDGINKYTFADDQTGAIWYNDGSFIGDGKTSLDPEDDAATANWGNGWQMPTLDQFNELISSEYTSTEWVEINGVNGYKITSKIEGYTDKYIFLPAAGRLDNSGILGYTENTIGSFWTNHLDSEFSDYAGYLNFYKEDTPPSTGVHSREFGFSVRAVRK